MDIWNARIGQPVDLGPATPEAADDLAVAGRIMELIAGQVRFDADTRLEALTWSPAGTPPAGSRLRLAVVDRSASGRVATLRVSRVDDAEPAELVADLRCRRGTPRDRSAHNLLRTPVHPGAQCVRRFVVDLSMTTDHVPGAAPVLTTPTLIALMEDTAADVLRPRFATWAASVGTWIGVRHTGAAHVGQQVEVSAVVADVRGRQVIFDVWAKAAGRPIGDGQVTQTLIRTDRPA